MTADTGHRTAEKAGNTLGAVKERSKAMQEHAKKRENASNLRGQAEEALSERAEGSSGLRSAGTPIHGDTGRLPTRDELRKALAESRQRHAEVAAQLAAWRAILSHREFEPVVGAILDSCKRLTGATIAYLTLLSEDGTENQVIFWDADGAVCCADPPLSTPDGELCQAAYQSGQAVYKNRYREPIRMQFMPPGKEGIRNLLLAPLSINRIVVGLLGLGNKPDGFLDTDASMVSAFGEPAATALLNSRTLESLQKSEERFRAVSQTANDAIITIDRDGTIVFWNRAAETIFGYTPSQAIGQSLAFVIPEPFDAAHHDGLERLVSTGETRILGNTVELVGLPSDGCEFPIELSLSTWKSQGQVFFTGIIRDVTERKGMEEALRRERDFTSAVLDTEGALVVVLDPLGRIVRFNRACENLTDYTFDEIEGKHLWDLFLPPEELEAVKAVFAELRAGQFPNQFENYWVTRDGSRRLIAWSNTALVDGTGTVEYIIGTGLDVTEHRRAEEALQSAHDELEQRVQRRTAQLAQANLDLQAEIAHHKQTAATLSESEERYRRLVELSFEAILIHSEGKLVYINPAGAGLLGATNPRELVGKPIRDLVHPDYWDLVWARVQKAREARDGAPLIEEKLLRLDGTPVEVEAASIPTTYQGQPALQTVVRDITTRKRAAAERELERTRIARDLHDSLGHSLGYLHLKLDQLAGSDAMGDVAGFRQELGQMRDVSSEAYETVRGMLAALLPAGSADLAAAMVVQAQVIGERGGFEVRVSTEGRSHRLTPILQQQVLYLFQEALINVERHAHAQQAHIKLSWAEDCLTVIMADDGCGFKVDALQTQGHYGLRVMQERADEIKGRLTLTSRPGAGTEVTLQLPLTTNKQRGTDR